MNFLRRIASSSWWWTLMFAATFILVGLCIVIGLSMCTGCGARAWRLDSSTSVPIDSSSSRHLNAVRGRALPSR